MAQFSLHVHKGGLKPDSFHLLSHRISQCRYSSVIKTIPLHYSYYRE